jgi:aconitate hydratase
VRRDPFGALREFEPGAGRRGLYCSLAALEAAGLGAVSRLPVSLRIVLESLLRHCDGERVTEAHVRELAAWRPRGARTAEIPFFVARILLQELTGIPTMNDFAAMRAAALRVGADPARIEPLVPVDLVVDHSVEVDVHGTPDALRRNMEIEFRRNAERYALLKWGAQAFSGIRIVPPGNGIVHQVNLERLARGVWERDGLYYPDTLVGTDSHTPMVNGIGVLGWGVGGIEGIAGMLGEPICFLAPDVVGVHLAGRLAPGVTATDLVLSLTAFLRRANVVGKFVEYFGEGAASLSPTDRATVANMAPDYGATVGFFPADEKTLDYFRATGREPEHVEAIERYLRAQGLFGIPRPGACDYSEVLEFDLSRVEPSVSGPRRPQERLGLAEVGARFAELLGRPADEGGYGKGPQEAARRYPTANPAMDVGHGDILIAAITSCTNTSNPHLMIAAGLLAKKAVERGLKPHPRVKTSLAPGSKVVTAYLREAGLLPFLEELGFHLVGYGCTTCMGNSGPLDPALEEAVRANDVVACAVLSGNRNFEARVHNSLRANFLASPPLVVAYALAGTVAKDLSREPLGTGSRGEPVYLRDLWPSEEDIAQHLPHASDPRHFLREYGDFGAARELWDAIPAPRGALYEWDPRSHYILEPPFFEDFALEPGAIAGVRGARALAIFGDSLTTDHISPVGAIAPDSPAGRWLRARGVAPHELGTYGARRCNHEVMVRGTFANVRIRNRLAPEREGGYTVHRPSGELTTIFEAAQRYRAEGVPLLVFAGEEYGTGSSRDWAARGPRLLGVRAVVARSFERIHRSNLVGMGILPCQFQGNDSFVSLGIDGTETFDLLGVDGELKPKQDVTLVIHRADGSTRKASLILRADTPIEAKYLRHGGILPYVLRKILTGTA